MQVQSNMSAIKNISLSQEVSANNMANISTDGFKASKVDRLTISPEARSAALNGADKEISTTEPTQDFVQMTLNQTNLEASIKSIQTQDQMLQALLAMKK